MLCSELRIGDKVEFIYNNGQHSGSTRHLVVDSLYDDDDFGGYEELVALGEYRRFKPKFVVDLRFIGDRLITITLTPKELEILKLAIEIMNNHWSGK